MLSPEALLVCRAPASRKAVRAVIESVGNIELVVCSTEEQAFQEVRRKNFVLVLADLDAVGGNTGASQLLTTIAANRHPCPALFFSDRYDKDVAIALLRSGAADCLELPLDTELLAHRVEALTLRLRPANGASPRRMDNELGNGDDQLVDLVTLGMDDLMARVWRVAPQDVTILLTGETGTGKTILARAIHDLSTRREEPFSLVDCTTLPPSVIESELFGHVKGAFTGADRDRVGKLATAGAGTLLLDEVNSLPVDFQAKLLRAVDERRFEPVGAVQPLALRARLIAASNVSLEQAIAAGQFRSDLYYRLNVVEFNVPPLRERRGAIGALAARFLQAYADRNGLQVAGFRPDVLDVLDGHEWPGNVRELRNVVEHACAVCEGSEIELKDLPPALRNGYRPSRREPGISITLHEGREETERRQIAQALRKYGNNRKRVAQELGISRMGLYKKLHKYGFIESTKAAECATPKRKNAIA